MGRTTTALMGNNGMTHKLQTHQTMRAELQPNCYGGKTCDKIVPQWYGYCDGDKEGEAFREPITLDPRQHPPGTFVTVREPICPDCGELRGRKHPEPKRGPVFEDTCRCGFDWATWTLNVYS